MNPLIDFLTQCEGTTFVNQDGERSSFKLLPPMNEDEIKELTSRIPCPIPTEIVELLRFARGFAGTWLEEVKFATLPDFGLEEIFPCAIELAHDGCGNFWVLDLTKHSSQWGPIFYACHDAPVIVYQTDSLLHFVMEAVREGKAPWKSEIGEVHGRLSGLIWCENPGVLSFTHCVRSADKDLSEFAQTLDDTWLIIDLRNPVLGDGFSWGRYGRQTQLKRFGEKRIFAYQRKPPLRRFMDRFR